MTPDVLSRVLAGLAVRIDDVRATTTHVAVPSYGGLRPSTVVALRGDGCEGRGEHVGWTDAAHAAACATVARVAWRGDWRVGEMARHLAAHVADDAYLRAALEAAAIDLALRQAGTTLLGLAGVAPRPVRYVVSFGRTSDPITEAARHPGVGLKIDVDPAWPSTTWEALAATKRVAVFDWKGGGDPTAYAAAACGAAALHEDPCPPYPSHVAARRCVDAALSEPAVLDAIDDGDVPLACNLKPGRMGGVLAVVEAAARASRRGIAVYLGGMFEVDVGRDQLLALATVLAPDGPNDIAPIPRGDAPAARPASLMVDPRAGGLAA